MDLKNATEAELTAELERRKAEKAAEEAKAAMIHAEVVVDTAKSLLRLAPEHSRTSCSDDNVANGTKRSQGRCLRCILLDAAEGYFPDTMKIEINYSRR